MAGLTFSDGHECPKGTARSKRARHGQGEFAFALEDGAQQRTPGQRDAHLVDATTQRAQRLHGVAHQEQRVRQTALVRRPRGPSGRLDETSRAGIDPDRQNFRARSRELPYGRTVAGTKIEDRPREAADQLVELADVELAQVVTSDHAHWTRIIAHGR